MSKTQGNPMVEWEAIPWRKLERRVFRLQKRIFQASQRGDVKVVRRLQKTLLRSWSAKCLAVRKVTQDNQGKKTAGVDGVKSLTPKQRLALVNNLELTGKAKATRRVWIPKPGRDEKRPLGIPTMTDRALQALVKLALEPEWEAKFELNSYGFRPGRSCHDAIGATFAAISRKAKYVLDADIAKCFDRINHKALLAKIDTFPTLRRQIKAWLKSGVMDGKELFPTDEGTPQVGVISPLLANIALHGMEERIKAYAATWTGDTAKNVRSISLIRYADDFVVLHKDKEVILKCKEILEEWLKGMGLELKPSKTRISHTLEEVEGKTPGFDFLGFNVRQYPVGKYHSGKSRNKELLGFKTLIKPSKQSVQAHLDNLKEVIRKHRSTPQRALISKLNPIISGWRNYYSTVVSKDVFSRVDYLLYEKLESWGQRRHPNKSKQWVASQYWKSVGSRNWVFADGELTLLNHADNPITRHVKVKGNASPFDGNDVYWSARLGKHPEVSTGVAKLLKRQKGKCTHCNDYFKDGDIWEIDHIVPRSQGGEDKYDNLQLLHRHCHDVKSANDNGLIIEEPDEVKVSRPVLKTSRSGDTAA